MIRARLIDRGWLRRSIEVSLPDGRHVVAYDGTGCGFERVIVDGVIIRETSLFWFVPRFEFKLGGWPGVVAVRVWPWLLLRSLVLRIGDSVVYAEGTSVRTAKTSRPPDDWAELG